MLVVVVEKGQQGLIIWFPTSVLLPGEGKQLCFTRSTFRVAYPFAGIFFPSQDSELVWKEVLRTHY